MSLTYLSLGSNMGNRLQLLHKAVELLMNRAGKVLAQSSFHETEPWGFASTNNFLNAAVLLETPLSPMKLLEQTELIERDLGRNSKSNNGVYKDRPIDIDILLYDDQVISTQRLVVPHPAMHLRSFVMCPLTEIAAEIIHPVLKKSIFEITKELS